MTPQQKYAAKPENREAEGLTCYLCGLVTEKTNREVDHVVPLAREGTHSLDNLRCACKRCNRRKHDKLLEEFVR